MSMCRSLLAVTAAAVLLLSACSSDDDAASATTTSTSIPEVEITLAITGVEANGTAPPSEDVVEAAVATLDEYIAGAVVAPLQTGEVADDLEAAFMPEAAARLDTDDRAALVDDRLPRLPRVRAKRADVSLSTLAGPDGQIGVIVASLDLAIRATGDDDDLDITHAGDLALVPDGASWKIDSYSMHTTRERHPEPTTTTEAE